MKLQSWMLVGLSSVALVAVACDDDDPAATPAPATKGGSAGSAGAAKGGSAGAVAGGAAGAAAGAPAGGSAGAPAGGSAGAPAGGSAGAPAGGSAGAPAGGSAGAPAGGSAGAPAGGSAGAPAGGSAGAPAGGSAGAPAGGSGGAATARKSGSVYLSQFIIDTPGFKSVTSGAGATFVQAGPPPQPSGTTKCTEVSESGCDFLDCETDSAAGGAAGSAGAAGAGGSQTVNLSAGDITISGLDVPDVKLTFQSAEKGYTTFSGMMQLSDGGETVKVVAGGATVPAFTGTLLLPVPVVYSKPTLPVAPAKLDLDQTKDFEIEWNVDGKTPMSAGLTYAKAEGTKSRFVSLVCKLDGAAKKGILPKSLLGKFPKGDASLGVSQTASGTVAAGEYDVSLSASGVGTSIGGQVTVK